MEFTGDEVASMLDELGSTQDRINDFNEQLAAVTVTATSHDRSMTATVGGDGKLADLKLSGTSWRSMPPKELTAKLTGVIVEAQNKAAERVQELADQFQPQAGGMLDDDFDIESMLGSLMADLGAQPKRATEGGLHG